ncbi:MAG: hypothetical protein GC159_09240 [Phycisphaera sp.]|nr:hypothetical protein [Phycisphaera sp.]
MRLSQYIKPEYCFVLEKPESRDALLRELADRIGAASGLDADKLYESLLERESKGSTATPEGVALPHAMLDEMEGSIVALARVKGGVDFQSEHVDAVDLVFVLVGQKSAAWQHISLLARVARVCRGGGCLDGFRESKTGEELYERLIKEDDLLA